MSSRQLRHQAEGVMLCPGNAQIHWKDHSFLEGIICSCTMLYLELACEDIVKENGDTVLNRLRY